MIFQKMFKLQSQAGFMMPRCQQCVRRTFSGYGDGAAKFLFGENFRSKWRELKMNLTTKLCVAGNILTHQCNLVVAHRLRRTYQILLLYRYIYGERTLMQNIRSHISQKKRPLFALLSASLFQWDHQRVKDEEIKRCREEIEEVHKLIELTHQSGEGEVAKVVEEQSEWIQIVDSSDFMVWRRHIPNSQLYQYRVFGQFEDIPARAFYNTQVDLNYWKDWDKNTIEVRIVDKDVQTSSEVVHWVYKYPYPMYPRDYVYVRRYKTDPESNTMVIMARATEHPSCPVDNYNVRVSTYCSQMVIKPHTNFDENGFDYVMTYFDDPQTHFPTVCYNWMASTGVHEFLERVHRASKKKHERAAESSTSRIEQSAGNLYSKMVHH